MRWIENDFIKLYCRYTTERFKELRNRFDEILTGESIWGFHFSQVTLLISLKGGGGVGKLATVRRWFLTVAIDVCLFLNFVAVFSSTYFRYLLLKPS
jgi:hypothetical protein